VLNSCNTIEPSIEKREIIFLTIILFEFDLVFSLQFIISRKSKDLSSIIQHNSLIKKFVNMTFAQIRSYRKGQFPIRKSKKNEKLENQNVVFCCNGVEKEIFHEITDFSSFHTSRTLIPIDPPTKRV
jgi:hypothetical protein